MLPNVEDRQPAPRVSHLLLLRIARRTTHRGLPDPPKRRRTLLWRSQKFVGIASEILSFSSAACPVLFPLALIQLDLASSRACLARDGSLSFVLPTCLFRRATFLPQTRTYTSCPALPLLLLRHQRPLSLSRSFIRVTTPFQSAKLSTSVRTRLRSVGRPGRFRSWPPLSTS